MILNTLRRRNPRASLKAYWRDIQACDDLLWRSATAVSPYPDERRGKEHRELAWVDDDTYYRYQAAHHTRPRAGRFFEACIGSIEMRSFDDEIPGRIRFQKHTLCYRLTGALSLHGSLVGSTFETFETEARFANFLRQRLGEEMAPTDSYTQTTVAMPPDPGAYMMLGLVMQDGIRSQKI